MVEVVSALDVDTGWMTLALTLAGTLLMMGALGLLNMLRGRRFVLRSHRVGFPELVAFLVLPAGLYLVLGDFPLFAVTTIVVNAAIAALAYLVVGFGLLSIVRWVVARLLAQLRASLSALAQAVPLLLFFSLVSFFTAEIWEVFTATGRATYWTAIGMFVLVGTVFLIVRLPSLVRDVEAESHVGDVPLRRGERLNLAALALLSESLQVFFVSAGVWLFYVILGMLLVSSDVRGSWLDQPESILWAAAWLGEPVQITSELLRVATGVAAFAGLYYAVSILINAAHRDQFVDALSKELRGTLERRSEYLELLRRRGGTAVGGESTSGR